MKTKPVTVGEVWMNNDGDKYIILCIINDVVIVRFEEALIPSVTTEAEVLDGTVSIPTTKA